MIDTDIITFIDLSTLQGAEVAELVTDLQVSYTMDQASQITVSVLDKDFRLMRNNYFQIRREIAYRGRVFEIAAIDVDTADGAIPLIRVEARSKAIQLMKRDKKPESYRGVSATDFAQIVASRFGLKLFAQQTTKKQTIVKGRNANSDDSVWDVLQRAASDAQFVVFESDGTLFFCSQQFLLGKIGIDTVVSGSLTIGPDYPGTPVQRGDTGANVVTIQQGLIDAGYTFTGGADGVFGPITEGVVKRYQSAQGLLADGIVGPRTWSLLLQSASSGSLYIPVEWPPPTDDIRFLVLQQPTVRRSDDDPLEGDGGVVLERTNGVQIRPGQTIGLKGIPTFEGLYLVTDVQFNEGVPDPVRISFRTPEKPDANKVASSSTTSLTAAQRSAQSLGLLRPDGTIIPFSPIG